MEFVEQFSILTSGYFNLRWSSLKEELQQDWPECVHLISDRDGINPEHPTRKYGGSRLRFASLVSEPSCFVHAKWNGLNSLRRMFSVSVSISIFVPSGSFCEQTISSTPEEELEGIDLILSSGDLNAEYLFAGAWANRISNPLLRQIGKRILRTRLRISSSVTVCDRNPG